MKKKIPALSLLIIAFGLFAFVPKNLFPDPWPVPDAYKNKVNPIKGDVPSLATGKTLYNQAKKPSVKLIDATVIATGKELWMKHCKSCHGTKGKGDGPKAAQLDTDCGDFSKPAFQAQTDGALYYKTEKGRKDMPSYKTKIPDENNMWAVVNYMRTFK